MIVGNIKDAKRYFSVNNVFAEVFKLLENLRADTPTGSIEREDFRVNVMECEPSDLTVDGSAKPFEAHRAYIDIHYVIAGKEGIGYAEVERLEPITEYDESADYLLLLGEYNKIKLGRGDFCVVYPEDAHIPCMYAGSDKLKKAVVKIKL